MKIIVQGSEQVTNIIQEKDSENIIQEKYSIVTENLEKEKNNSSPRIIRIAHYQQHDHNEQDLEKEFMHAAVWIE